MFVKKSIKQKILHEIGLALSFVFANLVLLPLVIYLTGEFVFGKYTGAGLYDFYVRMIGDIRNGHSVVWFLALSPYLIIILLRLTIWAVRKNSRII